MVPAAALAEELARRGHHVALVSDDRGVRFPGLFEDVETHVLPAGRLGGGPLGWLRAAGKMMAGRSMALRALQGIAAELRDRLRRLSRLARRCSRRFARASRRSSMSRTRCSAGSTAMSRARSTRSAPPTTRSSGSRTSGCPRRISSAIRCARRSSRSAHRPYPMLEEDGIFRVLVTGGSQGASILSQVVPDGLALLPGPFPPPDAGDSPGADRGHRDRPRQIQRARHPRRNRDLPPRHARASGVDAYRHRARRRLDDRRAHRRGPSGHPGAAADRHRRSPDRQRARDHQGGRRADDPAALIHRLRARQADPEAGPRYPRARECRRAGVEMRSSRCRARPRRPRRDRFTRPRPRSTSAALRCKPEGRPMRRSVGA